MTNIFSNLLQGIGNTVDVGVKVFGQGQSPMQALTNLKVERAQQQETANNSALAQQQHGVRMNFLKLHPEVFTTDMANLLEGGKQTVLGTRRAQIGTDEALRSFLDHQNDSYARNGQSIPGASALANEENARAQTQNQGRQIDNTKEATNKTLAFEKDKLTNENLQKFWESAPVMQGMLPKDELAGMLSFVTSKLIPGYTAPTKDNGALLKLLKNNGKGTKPPPDYSKSTPEIQAQAVTEGKKQVTLKDQQIMDYFKKLGVNPGGHVSATYKSQEPASPFGTPYYGGFMPTKSGTKTRSAEAMQSIQDQMDAFTALHQRAQDLLKEGINPIEFLKGLQQGGF